jgi:hypothetical protein
MDWHEGVFKNLARLCGGGGGRLASFQGLPLFINSGSTLRLAIHPPARAAPASQVFKHALDQDLERCQSRGIFAACHRAIDLLSILTSRKR